MPETPLGDLVAYIDQLLEARSTPDYPQAINGLQFAKQGPVTGVASAVDFSLGTVHDCVRAGADLLLVHHGMFWGGAGPIVGERYGAIRELVHHDIAVYSAHLPLDRHAEFGNGVLLARALGLEPSGEFARFESIHVGVRGEADLATAELLERAGRFARRHGGEARVSPIPDGHRTRRWAICTGAGASSDTLGEAAELEIDTLIVGEGPHWTAVAAADASRVIIYAGHYATETVGVQALAEHVAERYGLKATFLPRPTSL